MITDTHTNEVTALVNRANDELAELKASLEQKRHAKRMLVKDIGASDTERWEAQMPGEIYDLSRAEEDADDRLGRLHSELKHQRTLLRQNANTAPRMAVSDEVLSQAGAMVPALQAQLRSGTPGEILASLEDAAEAPGEARAAAWALLASEVRGTRINDPIARSHIDAALNKCRTRVMAAPADDLLKAVDRALMNVSNERSDLATRRGDGSIGGVLDTFEFGASKHSKPETAIDRAAVARRIGE